jgi:hypothetical protein
MKMNLAFENSGAVVNVISTHPLPIRKRRSKDGREVKNNRSIVFNSKMVEQESNIEDFFEKLQDFDEEIDMELAGRRIAATNRIVVNKSMKAVSSYKIFETLLRSDGSTQRREYHRRESNIDQEIPAIVSKTFYDPKEILTQFVFRKSYFLVHNDQASFGVLYNLASRLHDAKKFAKIATFNPETKEISPLILNQGGTLFSAVFLEGKIRNSSEYSLILHLSNYELMNPRRD